MLNDNKNVAVLIDAENISADYAEKILSEASNYGDVKIKRVFADWSNPQMGSWKRQVSLMSLKPVQQFAPVKGKNSSDISLIIEALTVLFEKNIDVFCLVSSDSDFIRLVQELKEREKFVVGFGMKQTTQAFVNSFSEFIYLDGAGVNRVEKKNEGKELPKEKVVALREIIEMLIEKYGKALYGNIGTEMRNKFSDFIPKNYGSDTMKSFIAQNLAQIGKYEIRTEKDKLTLFLVPKK